MSFGWSRCLGGNVKLAFFSDLHLDATFRGLGEAGALRRTNLRKTLRNIITKAHEEGADALLSGGDLYEHERSGPDTRSFLVQEFGDCEMPVLLAPGNHDWFGARTIYSEADWPDNVHVFERNQLTAYRKLTGVTIWGAAHNASTGTAGFFQQGFHVPDRGSVHLCLIHGAESSAIPYETDREGNPKSGHAPFTDNEIEASGLAHAFVGHYHSAKDHDLYTYAGSPDPLSFGEKNQAGLVVATVGSGGNVERERYEVWETQVHDLDLDITGAKNSTDVADRRDKLIAGLKGYARITVSGAQGPDVELSLEELETERAQLESLSVRRGNIVSDYDVDAIQTAPTVRGGFVHRVKNSDLADEEKSAILTAGLRALDRHQSISF